VRFCIFKRFCFTNSKQYVTQVTPKDATKKVQAANLKYNNHNIMSLSIHHGFFNNKDNEKYVLSSMFKLVNSQELYLLYMQITEKNY